MDDIIEFFLTGYITLPTFLGVVLDDIEIFAIFNLVLFCVLFVLAVNKK